MKKAYQTRKGVHPNQNECSKADRLANILHTKPSNKMRLHTWYEVNITEYFKIANKTDMLIRPISLTLYYREIVLVVWRA